jgi:asparagine synthase (glutamine-hydrolysing)
MESCRLAGVEVAFPMLDHRVVDFSLALAPNLKLKGTQLRYFFKEALRGFLPDQIIAKEKHGFGLPFGEWAIRHPRLREMTFDALDRFKRRGWVRSSHIDYLKDSLLPQLPNYYGSLAWLLMMLELWMQFHVDAAGGER